MKQIAFLLFCFLLCLSCKKQSQLPTIQEVHIDTLQGKSLLNKQLFSKQLQSKDSAKISNYIVALEAYNTNSDNPDTHIWLGRRMAYLGDYKEAINIYTKGLQKFPEDARLYRHRGHRYISTRQFDLAIEDLEKATEFIQGKEDIIEPDGIPNKLNQPVSSLHTNIYYHLGLAYYLKGDWRNALINFQSCLEASTNDDMRVATSHWLYMILRRMELPDEAALILKPINTDMTIIENDSYHMLLLYYKGELNENDLDANTSLGSNEAVQYGIAHWHQYNNQLETALTMYKHLVANGNWAGFGYIAAEAELSRMPQ